MPVTFGLYRISGENGKSNWILYRPAAVDDTASYLPDYSPRRERNIASSEPYVSRCIVFFPGDISDFFSPPITLQQRNGLLNSDFEESHQNKHDGYPVSENVAIKSLEYEIASCKYYPYSLEGLTWLLSSKFPNDHIVVIRAKRINDGFACYANFWPCDEIGNPRSLSMVAEMTSMSDVSTFPENLSSRNKIRRSDSESASTKYTLQNAPFSTNPARHLNELLKNLFAKVNEKPTSEDSSVILKPQKCIIELPPLLILGFSKGCIVLTAIIREFEEFKNRYPGKVLAVHYLDPGLSRKNLLFEFSCVVPLCERENALDCSSEENTNTIADMKCCDTSDIYSTNATYKTGNKDLQNEDKKLNTDKIESASSSGCNQIIVSPQSSNLKSLSTARIFFHSTPRQYYDKSRPHIHRELKNFYDLLKENGVDVHHFLYYSTLKASLNMHFEVLCDFQHSDKRSDENSEFCKNVVKTKAELFFDSWEQLNGSPFCTL